MNGRPIVSGSLRDSPSAPGASDALLISEIYEVLAESRPFGEVAAAICSKVCELLGYQSSAILLEHKQSDYLEIEGAAGLSSSYVEAVNSRFMVRITDPLLGEGPSSEAARTGRPVAINDIERDERFRRWRTLARGQGIRSLICLPLRSNGKTIGTLNCYRDHPYDYGDADVNVLSTVAAQTAIAIEIARLLQEQQATIGHLAVATRDLEEQRQLLERSEEINGRLTQLVLDDEDTPRIVAMLSEMVGCPVVMQDRYFAVVALAGGVESGDSDLPDAATVALVHARLHGSAWTQPLATRDDTSGSTWLVMPIVVAREIAGYISIRIEALPPSALVRRALSHASTVLALQMGKERLAHEMDVHVRATFVDDIVSGRFESPDRLRVRGRHLGYDLRPPFQVLVFAVAAPVAGPAYSDLVLERDNLIADVERALRPLSPGALVGATADQLTVVLTMADAAGSRVADAERLIRAVLRRAFPHRAVSAGIGSMVDEVALIPSSHTLARQALLVLRRLGGSGQSLSFEDMGLTRLLLQVDEPVELLRFARSRLAPILAYDQQYEGGLVSAARSYIESRMSIAATATRLGVHQNTVRYRLRKIETMLGVSLRDPAALFDIHLALLVLRIAGGDSDVPGAFSV